MKWFHHLILGLFLAALTVIPGRGDQSITLAWDQNPEADVSGYVVYYGTESRNYPNATNVGNVTTATVHGLSEDLSYYFAVTAMSNTGLESDFSNEVCQQVIPLIKSILLSVQEGTTVKGPWTNIWTIERMVNNSNYVYRVNVEIGEITNIIYTNLIAVETNVPPQPPDIL